LAALISALIAWAFCPGLAAQEPRALPIVGLDYAFQASDTVPAGSVVVSFLNRGTVHHEVVLYLPNGASTLSDYIRATGPLERQKLGRTIGLLAAGPGQSALGRLVTDLVRGQRYILLCNLLNAPNQPPHSRLGMGKVLVAK
jgi:hypothetical protein